MPSNSHIADWQRNVQLGREIAAYGTLAATLNVMGTIGYPDTDLGPEFVDAGETGSGTSERLATEFSVGKKQGRVSFDTRIDETRMYQFLRSIHQSAGTKTGSGPYTYTWSPWTDQPATNIGTSIILSARDTETNGGLSLLGAICDTIKLDQSEGSIVKGSASYRGITSGQVTPSAAAGTWAGTLKHMHFNTVLGIAGGGNVKPSKLGLELTNNLIAYYGTSQLPDSLVLGRYGLKGSFSVPWKGTGIAEFANYLNKTSRRLTVEYGTAAAAGYMKFDFDATYSVGKPAEENGLQMLPVEFVQSKNATTTVISLVSTLDLSLT